MFWLKREVPALFKCRRLRIKCFSATMLLLSTKPQSFCRQNFLSVLLTSVALFDSSESSARAVRLEMATEIPSCSTSRAKSILHEL